MGVWRKLHNMELHILSAAVRGDSGGRRVRFLVEGKCSAKLLAYLEWAAGRLAVHNNS